jgi:hypothetical protein
MTRAEVAAFAAFTGWQERFSAGETAFQPSNSA